MGGIVKAQCQCGYEREMLLGGGMSNFTTHCNFPAYCRDCEDLVEVNLLQKKTSCPKCKGRDITPYDDDSMCQEKGEPVFSWNVQEELGGELILTDGRYLCPNCGEFSLCFQEAGCWD
ncbi:hypothetical protein ACFLU6_05750 [Acidobacteriota bacterium]